MTDRLTIMLLTCAKSLKSERHAYAKTTLRSTLDKLRFDGELAVHIADDGSPQKHRDALREIAGGYGHVVTVSESNSEGRGYGANFNLATQSIHEWTTFVLPLEDDWELEQDLDVTPYCEALAAGIFDCVRLGYIGWTQRLAGHFRAHGDNIYLHLDPNSDEPHVWAGHPRIETARYQREVGLWPEGIDPGSTEFAVAHRMRARVGVAWPMGYWENFVHIGSVQAREDQ